MIDADFEDTHLCIKCSSTIVGIENYINHRKNNCRTDRNVGDQEIQHKMSFERSAHTQTSSIISTPRQSNLDNSYESFSYQEPEAPSSYVNKTQHGGKTGKTLGDDTYELGADVFFSSLQLQSVQASGPSTSGKTSSSGQTNHLMRQKSLHQESDDNKVPWITGGSSQRHNTETLMKAVNEISMKHSYDNVFKPLNFAQESPDVSDDEEEEDDDDVEMDEDDEDYDPLAEGHANGGKWKPTMMPHSPPVVPASHTGGKWRPENRPHLRLTHAQQHRLSPNWDDQTDEIDVGDPGDERHPPANHTQGKWVPGTKVQRLEYKDVPELAKIKQDYWCKICCRRLKSKFIYESHLKTSYHLKRAEPELDLERASLRELQPGEIDQSFAENEINIEPEMPRHPKKRRRRAAIIKCESCKHETPRHLIGKHLISHYHYRRMHMNLGKSFRMILENIHSIVLQSPFQCRPCRFYCNTEATFLQHWDTAEHRDALEGPGRLYCSFCYFECEDNNQMRRHLLSAEHKEVILAINRSVPICITKKLSISCTICGQSMRYNIELRRHIELCHPGMEFTGTASDMYQSRFKCETCNECCHSQTALQRHQKFKHHILEYFCSICGLEFSNSAKAIRHRQTSDHLKKARIRKRKNLKITEVSKQDNFIATSEVEAILHELSHPRAQSSPKAKRTKKVKESNKTTKYKSKRNLVATNENFIVFKCKDCAECFLTKDELMQHHELQHPLTSRKCGFCGLSFLTPQALGHHTRKCGLPTTSQEASMIAKQINEIQEKHSEMENLMENTDGDKKFSCDECDFLTGYRSELIYHQIHHIHGRLKKTAVVSCPLCEKSFSKYSLRFHLRQHTNEKIFECDYCQLKFSRPYNLKDHIKQRHLNERRSSTKQIIGDTKNKATAASTAIAADDSKCNKNDKDSCEQQQHKDVSQVTVKREGIVEVKHEVEGVQCDTCGKVFKTKYSLKQHVMTAHRNGGGGGGRGANQVKYACHHKGCSYVATHKSNLKMHMTTHSNEQYKCQEANCNYIGKSSLHVIRHARYTHASDDKPPNMFVCDKCDFKTKIKSHLNRHAMTHIEKKSFKCPHCPFTCRYLDNLRKHILKTKKHPGKFIYECKKCSKTTATADGVKLEGSTMIFKTNSYQEYQNHLTAKHKTEAEGCN